MGCRDFMVSVVRIEGRDVMYVEREDGGPPKRVYGVGLDQVKDGAGNSVELPALGTRLVATPSQNPDIIESVRLAVEQFEVVLARILSETFPWATIVYVWRKGPCGPFGGRTYVVKEDEIRDANGNKVTPKVGMKLIVTTEDGEIISSARPLDTQ